LTRDDGPLLEISGLSVVLRERRILDDLDLRIAAGEILALVGASGAGKTVTALAILGLLPPRARIEGGRILYQGRNLLKLEKKELREIRGCGIGMIFQDPRAALNPLMRIDQQLCEGMKYRLGYSKRQALEEGERLLEDVGIQEPKRCLKAYPHQLSGGMRQRITIAAAVSCSPQLLICDEITSSVDSIVQGRILLLLRRLSRHLKLSILLITHDLRAVRQTADRMAVMLDGKVVEEGCPRAILARPSHEFTRSLIAMTSGRLSE
jgi:ABC-type dipeptide/oligopeptide/nickel transport system ATPase component